MANKSISPYGAGGQLPSSIGIIDDLVTGGANMALSARQGKVIKDDYLDPLGNIIEPGRVETTNVTNFTSGSVWKTYNKAVGSTYDYATNNSSGTCRTSISFKAGDTIYVWGKGNNVGCLWMLLQNGVIKSKSNNGGDGSNPSSAVSESNPNVLTPDYDGVLCFSSVTSVSYGVRKEHAVPASLVVADSDTDGLMSKELASLLDADFVGLMDDIKQTPYTDDIEVEILSPGYYYNTYLTASIGSTWSPSLSNGSDKKCTRHSIVAGDVIDIWGKGTGPAALYVITDENNIVRARGEGGEGVSPSTVYTEESPLTITSQWTGTIRLNSASSVDFGATIHRTHSGAKRATTSQDGLMTKEQVSLLDAIASQNGGYAQKRIAIIGDSFTAGGTWVSKMCTALGATGVNKALSGGQWTYSSDIPTALSCARNLYTQYSQAGVSPDYVLVLYGVNDYGNAKPIGSINYNSLSSQSSNSESQIASNVMSHYSYTGGTFSSGVQAAISYLQLVFPDAIIFVGWTPAGQQYMRTNLSRENGGWDNDFSGGVTVYAANKYIDRLKQLALMHGVRYIDTFNCGINPWLTDHRSKYQTSENDAHPYTEAAGTRIAAYMARLLIKEV